LEIDEKDRLTPDEKNKQETFDIEKELE